MKAKLIILHWRPKTHEWEQVKEEVLEAKVTPKRIVVNWGAQKLTFDKNGKRVDRSYGGSMYKYRCELILSNE